MITADDHGSVLGRDPACHWCGHSAHHYLACSDRCACDHKEVIGIDTALRSKP